ncbi:MAG: hypothetical protein RLZZ308_401 [Candidatus Parcubacteria bacterium]|jgi:xanthosine utilization system XapX-like protein
MDILTLISLQVPAYYAIVPVVVLIGVLITLLVKPAVKPLENESTSSLQTNAGVTPDSTSEPSVPPVTATVAIPPQEVSSSTEQGVTLDVDSTVIQKEVTPSDMTSVDTSVVESAIPPISSWKPAEPAPLTETQVAEPVETAITTEQAITQPAIVQETKE